MKLKPHVSCHLLDVYTRFQIHISKHVKKKVCKTFRWLGALLTSPYRVFLSTRGPKISQAWRKSVGVKALTIWVCVLNLRPLYNLNADKWLWPIFGCKVGQSVQMGMKLELDMWHHLLDLYTKFQTDISKHVQKSLEKFSLAGSSTNAPFQLFLSARGPKIIQPWRKSVGINTLTI